MNLPNEISGTFNRNITLGSGTLRVYKEGFLFLTFMTDDISVIDNTFTIETTNLIPDLGSYYINFDSGLFISDIGEVYAGINNDTDWAFEVTEAAYESSSYSNDYLI